MSGSTNEPRDIRAVYPGSCARALLDPAFLVWRRMSSQSLQNAAVCTERGRVMHRFLRCK